MPGEIRINICLGSSCFSRGNKEVVMFVKEYLKKHHLEDKVIFKGARCMGNCSNGPNMMFDEVFREGITMQKIEGILENELAKLK
jgi:NADH:ubiquinone oxidoreductase subunit E